MARAEAKYVITAEDATAPAFASVKAKFGAAARGATRAAAGIATAGAAGFAAMAKQAIDAADETSKLSRQIGISTENLTEMKGVLDLTGGSFDGYTRALGKMQRSIVNLSDDSSEMKDAFDAVGLSLEDLQGLTTEEQFNKLLMALSDMEDVTARNARAYEIFGRNADTVLKLVDTGPERIAKMREEQRKLGNTMDKETAEAAERVNDAFTTMMQTLRGAVLQTTAANMSEIAEAMEQLARGLPAVINAIVRVGSFIGDVTEAAGANAAIVGALGRGDISGALAIGREARANLFGGDEDGSDKVVREQQETNAILGELARNGMVGRAG